MADAFSTRDPENVKPLAEHISRDGLPPLAILVLRIFRLPKLAKTYFPARVYKTDVSISNGLFNSLPKKLHWLKFLF